MMISFSNVLRPLLGAGVVAFLITGCEKEVPAPVAPAAESAIIDEGVKEAPEEAPAAPEAAAKASQPAAPEPTVPMQGQTADAIFASPPPVELNGFGSDEVVERQDLPSRGVNKLGPQDFIHTTMEHWEQYDWTSMQVKRWGRFRVRLTYTLAKAGLPLQMRLGEQRLKKTLKNAPTPTQVTMGVVSIEKAGDVPFAMFTPSSGGGAGLEIREVAFIPTVEDDEEILTAEDGSITLLAKVATTWSETMRYEPKEEKNCLGFWTEVEDFAEWEFVTTKPGRYKVSVSQGCGNGNGGSRVEVRLGEQKLEFTVEETGGFQNWKLVEVGEIEVKQGGLQRLIVQPLDKKGKAVMDIQKVVLTPAAS